MKSFLAELSETLYKKYRDNFQDLTIVFPNRRAGLFFRKYLSGNIEKPVWAPRILNIDEYIKSLSSLQSADQLTLLFLLYESYSKISPTKESFDQFYHWGEMLLRDFNEVDKYLIKAEDLFIDLKNQKDLEQRFSYLTDEQIKVIQKFWQSFSEKPSKHQEDFLQVWHILADVYIHFKESLSAKGIGYDGMIFRDVVERIQAGNGLEEGRQLIFAGFNAFTRAEELIIATALKSHNAEIYWDFDQYYFNNPDQEAGAFLRKYAKDKKFTASFPPSVPDVFASSPKAIEMIGVPLAVGQAKLLGEYLQKHLNEQILREPEKTAIVLPDEQMLFPVLHSLPDEFEEVNITMGYPLRDTPLYGFLEHLLDLQQNLRENKKSGKISFYYANVLSLLKHPYFSRFTPAVAIAIIKDIETKNKIQVEIDDLNNDFFYRAVFQKVEAAENIFDYLLDVLLLINRRIGDETDEKSILVEKEYIFHFYTQLKRLKEIVNAQEITFTIQTFLKIFRQMIRSLKLPFSGEPLNGLQVMGVLETRNLDFDNVYILSMNEGNFPPGNSQSSFIPFNLRKGYNLPTYEQQDAIYAYNFYRLIQRAKKVFLFYNTESGIQTGGEMSRFLYQLRFESPLKISEKILSNPIKVPFPVPITIPKEEPVLERLNEYCLGETGDSTRCLTPSAFNIYLDCRLKFYFRYVARLFESDTMQEEIDAASFGNLLHRTMEIFYKEILERKGSNHIAAGDLESADQLEGAVDESFIEHYHWKNTDEVQFEGRNYIVKEIVMKMAKKILENDRNYAPFSILGLEAEDDSYRTTIPITTTNGSKQVRIKGVIDRVDQKNDIVRVIDYKTGKDNKVFESVASLFDRENKKRNKAAMQTLIYSQLYEESGESGGFKIMPGLYNARELFRKSFDITLQIKPLGSRQSEAVLDARPFFEDLKMGMGKLLEEVFNPQVSFDQTSDLRVCQYCPYAGICHR